MSKKTILFLIILFLPFLKIQASVFAVAYQSESNTVQTQVGNSIEPSIGPDTPSGWPIKGPFSDCFIAQTPYSGYGTHANSNAVDIALARGTPVYATLGGKVKKVVMYENTWGVIPSFGTYIQITNNNIWAIYAHLLPNSVSHIVDGQIVNREDLIGKVDNTGYSSGDHLHYELPKGLSFPLPYESACQ